MFEAWYEALKQPGMTGKEARNTARFTLLLVLIGSVALGLVGLGLLFEGAFLVGIPTVIAAGAAIWMCHTGPRLTESSARIALRILAVLIAVSVVAGLLRIPAIVAACAGIVFLQFPVLVTMERRLGIRGDTSG